MNRQDAKGSKLIWVACSHADRRVSMWEHFHSSMATRLSQ